MIGYQDIKAWFENKENKQKLVYGLCFVLVFVIGFGAGKFDKEVSRPLQKSQTNYTTKTPVKQTAANGGGEKGFVAGTSTLPTATSSSAGHNCLIRGNASSHIYHMPGGAFYTTLKSPQCFETEAQAQAAGYRKSGR